MADAPVIADPNPLARDITKQIVMDSFGKSDQDVVEFKVEPFTGGQGATSHVGRITLSWREGLAHLPASAILKVNAHGAE